MFSVKTNSNRLTNPHYLPGLKKMLKYRDNFCNRASFKIAQQLINRTLSGLQDPAMSLC